MKTTKRTLLSLTALLAALLCTACGGADGDNAAPPDSSRAANPLSSEISEEDEVMGTPYIIDDYYIF